MTKAMTERVVLVTGGGSGIGHAVVEALRQAGAHVVAIDKKPPEGARFDGVMKLGVDVTDEAAVQDAVVRIVDELGGIDGLVQCAGVTDDAVLWKMTPEAWREVLDVNLTGAFLMLRAVAPRLRARGGGAVVNVTSINGMRGKFGQANYAASKAGLIGLTKTAARELGTFGVRVNAVAPGFVNTPMTADLPVEVVDRALEEAVLGRVSEPADVAAAILFLLSDAARQITGETLRVDGGQYI